MATDPNRERHVMSQIARERRRLPVPLRWLRARGDPSQPDSGQSARQAPVDTLQIQPGRFFHSFARRRVHASRSRPQCLASIECAANLKSP